LKFALPINVIHTNRRITSYSCRKAQFKKLIRINIETMNERSRMFFFISFFYNINKNVPEIIQKLY